MSGDIQFVREELRQLKTSLDEDKSTFVTKLNQVRNDVFQHIDKQIQRLRLIQKEYAESFQYFEDENQRSFDRLCLSINQNEEKASDLLNSFRESFPHRPRMLKNIPEYDFTNVSLDSFIKDKRETNHQIIPIDDQPEIQQTTSSIGQSYHKQFAERNNQTNSQPQSRLVSTCSTFSGADEMINILFQISHKLDKSPRLISFNSDENYFLIYSSKIHKLVHLSNQTREFFDIALPFTATILNIGYSKFRHCFYFTSRQTNHFSLFRWNDQKIEIIQEFPLINEKEQFISGHIYENLIYFVYSSSSEVMFAKYDMETSSRSEQISLQNYLYDFEDKIKYRLVDFTVNDSFISCLVQLNSTNKWKIAVYDIKDFERIHSFELIDAKNPLSIVSAEKRELQCAATTTTMRNGNAEYSLLFVNDPKSHLIHCCNHFQYQTPIQVNAFGICALDDGNLALIGNKDIRGLNIQNYLEQNNVQLFTNED
ncbi:unnamed protein product [Adineta ricciae]|uniref:Uncharacterized protein n=1 Tax=Adineta ricciae TaxID=249248 RepID=A0A813YNK1_ADIRI|nr:unnamed protein product [Adineta ricciae]CAF1248690.1 unnamed protein product [Adineta ricciae]